VLIDKPATQPVWSPSSLDQVDEESLEAFFRTEADPPQLVLPEALLNSLHTPPSFLRYGLPTEDELQALVRGSHASSSPVALTLQELITKAEDLRGGKRGVAGKVQEVVSRRCAVDQDGYLQLNQ
jgi:3-hydroxyisobutyryl-CoA hydrolase